MYYYDCENRLTYASITYNYYKYDYSGRRVRKYIIGSSKTTKYGYDGDQIVCDYNDYMVLQRKYVYGPGIDEPICMIDVKNGNAMYYYHFDGLGSVGALSDTSGNIVEKYRYDVYGKPTIRGPSDEIRTTSAFGNRYMFTGREYDSETGLYYYRARYYSPKMGRFLQTDPIGYNGGLNLYTYVDNNPLNWVDPWGLWSEEIHKSFGERGFGGPRSKFDYGALDRDFSPWNSDYTWRHFRDFSSTYSDVLDAIQREDAREFQYHMHELQDYFSHRAKGYRAPWGHVRSGTRPDNPLLPENDRGAQMADQITREMEAEWHKKNPNYRHPQPQKKS